MFASFAILLNFPRLNKMKGMGQIVTWSVRDETLHTESAIKLFKTFVSENPEVLNPDLEKDIYDACKAVISHEDAFIDLAFELGGVKGLEASQVKDYIRYIADLRLTQLGMEKLFHIKEHPLPWMVEMLGGVEHTNFFEGRATEYSRASTKGSWDETFKESFGA